MYRLGLRDVPRLNGQVEPLSRLDVAVASPLLDHVDRQGLGPIRDARAAQVVDCMRSYASLMTQGLEATRHVVDEILPLTPPT